MHYYVAKDNNNVIYWKTHYEIGLYCGKRDAKELKDIYPDQIVGFSPPSVKRYSELSPEDSVNFIHEDSYKKYLLNPSIAAMIPSAVIGMKQTLDALETIGDEINGIKIKNIVAETIRLNAPVLKNKTLLVLDNVKDEAFYDQYAFKKEKVKKFDPSKLKSKNKIIVYWLIYQE